MGSSKSKRVGCTTKKSATTVRKLEEAFAMGCTVTEAAHFANISRETVYAWMREDEEFSDRIESLRLTPILKARMVVVKAIEDGDLQTSRKYLERKRPEELSLN